MYEHDIDKLQRHPIPVWAHLLLSRIIPDSMHSISLWFTCDVLNTHLVHSVDALEGLQRCQTHIGRPHHLFAAADVHVFLGRYAA